MSFDRPWLFLPGDLVLMLDGDKITAGVVQQISIPGPLGTEDRIIFIQPEEGAASWWNPDQVERIGK